MMKKMTLLILCSVLLAGCSLMEGKEEKPLDQGKLPFIAMDQEMNVRKYELDFSNLSFLQGEPLDQAVAAKFEEGELLLWDGEDGFLFAQDVKGSQPEPLTLSSDILSSLDRDEKVHRIMEKGKDPLILGSDTIANLDALSGEDLTMIPLVSVIRDGDTLYGVLSTNPFHGLILFEKKDQDPKWTAHFVEWGVQTEGLLMPVFADHAEIVENRLYFDVNYGLAFLDIKEKKIETAGVADEVYHLVRKMLDAKPFEGYSLSMVGAFEEIVLYKMRTGNDDQEYALFLVKGKELKYIWHYSEGVTRLLDAKGKEWVSLKDFDLHKVFFPRKNNGG